MRQAQESWKRLVLHSLPPPSWLGPDGPDCDVVISSRARLARNLAGHRFPHHASPEELREIVQEVLTAFAPLDLTVIRRMSPVEREFHVGCRMISADFDVEKPGRVLLLNAERSLSIMVNEEDHLRLQGLTAGWALRDALRIAEKAEDAAPLRYSHAAPWGYLTASPYNAGTARRLSALFHLVALGHSRQLPTAIRALSASGLVVRGIFGEVSRPVGAFVQVSWTGADVAPFLGAAEYLIELERKARAEFGEEELRKLTHDVMRYAITQREIGLGDAFRVLAYARWAAAATKPAAAREIDRLLSTLEISGRNDPAEAAIQRAGFLRNFLEETLGSP